MFLLLFIIGLFVGSFLGVLIDRLPKDETVIKGRSHCEFCKHKLSLVDLIPVFSFIFLKGKCRYCHKKLNWYYPIFEVSTGIIFALTYSFLVSNQINSPQLLIINLIYYLFIISCLIVIFFSDLKYGIIPDKILLPLTIIVFIYLIVFNTSSLITNLLAGVGALLFFILLILITKGKGMGMGDVKFSFLMGLTLGFPQIVVGLYVAFLTGAFISIILILWRKKIFKDTISFGPFLVFGTLMSIFLGNFLLQEALQILGL